MRTHKKETMKMMGIRSRKHRTRTKIVRRTRWRSRTNRRSPITRTRRDPKKKKTVKELQSVTGGEL